MPESVANVEKTDLTSGKIARVFSGATDLLTIGMNSGSQNRKPARAIVAQGAVTITGTDGQDVVLPDLGNFWWDIQAIAIVSGSGVAIW